MKKIFLLFGVLLFASHLNGQNPDGSYNPYVNEGMIAPSPLYPVELGGSGTISFNVGNSGSDPLDVYTDQYLTLTITLSYGEPNNSDPLLAVGGTAASLFNWSYSSGTYTAVQISQLAAGFSGTILIDYLVTSNSATPGSNGFNVNITPAAYQTGSNTLDDDAVSSYTYTEVRDFGDAPATYGEASHTIDFTNYLGSVVDGESSSYYSAGADGDDLNGQDDEDGVVLPSELQRGSTPAFPVTVTGLGYLNAWFDWNGDGDFLDAGERVASNLPRFAGTANLSVTVPADANISTSTFARFRFSSTSLSSPVGAVAGGEVEDYPVTIVCAPPTAGLTISENGFCEGTTVTLSASGGINYRFLVDGVIAQEGSNNEYVTDSLDNGQQVEVLVSDAIGCSAVSDPINVSVLTLPNAVLTSSDGDNVFCQGSEIVFSASGGVSYNFRINEASVQSGTGATYTTSALNNGQSLDVIVTAANGCQAASDAIVNIVNPLPVPTLSISDSDSIFCAGTLVTYSATGGTNYDFRIDGITVQNGNLTSFSSTLITDGQEVDVIVTDNNLCSSASGIISNSVLQLPSATISNLVADICQGETTAQLSGSVSGSASGGVWTTSSGGTFNPSATNLTPTWTPPLDFSGTAVLVLSTTGGECGTANTSIEQIVNATPILLITNPPTVCSPATVDLTAPSVTLGSTAGLEYTYWTNEDCTIAVSNATAVGAGTYYIRGRLASTGCYDIQPVLVSVTAKPATPLIDVVNNCDGTSDLSTTATGTLLWSNAGTASSISVSVSGTYTLTQTIDGCVSDEATAFADPHSPPAAPVVSNSSPENVCPDVTVNLADLITSATPANGFIYYKTVDDPGGVDVTDPEFVGAGSYFVFYEDENSCFSQGTEISVNIIECPPDLTPTLLVSPNIMHGETDFDLIVRVTELNSIATNGAIEIRIPKDSRWYLTDGFNQGLTSLNGTTINNADWTYSEDAINHIFTTSVSIPSGSYRSFGFSVTFDPGSTRGWYTITSQLVSGGGGETRVTNNVDSERIDYFQE